MLDGDKVIDEAIGIWDNIFGYDNSLVVYFLLAPCLKDILRGGRDNNKIILNNKASL